MHDQFQVRVKYASTLPGSHLSHLQQWAGVTLVEVFLPTGTKEGVV